VLSANQHAEIFACILLSRKLSTDVCEPQKNFPFTVPCLFLSLTRKTKNSCFGVWWLGEENIQLPVAVDDSSN